MTRNRFGSGTAWYVATRLSAEAMRALLAQVRWEAGVRPVADVPDRGG